MMTDVLTTTDRFDGVHEPLVDALRKFAGATSVLALWYGLLVLAPTIHSQTTALLDSLDGIVYGVTLITLAVTGTVVLLVCTALLGMVVTLTAFTLFDGVTVVADRLNPSLGTAVRVVAVVTYVAWMIAVGTVGIGAYTCALALAPYAMGVAHVLPLPEHLITEGTITILLCLLILSPLFGGKPVLEG